MRHPSHLRSPRFATSLIAMATVLVVGASPAAAQTFTQGFQGTITSSSGAGIVNTSDNSGTSIITLLPGQTVLNWTPTDNATNNGVTINFQPAGTTGAFTADGGFAVLNKINVSDTSRPIGLNGNLAAFSTGGGTTSVYFYAPGGFVVGSSAIINVGNLVLSASPILDDGNGNFISGANNSVTFGQAPNVNAQIRTIAGSQIGATGTNNYVAMVAPSIVHNGSIVTNGQAALVAAEAATINFSPDGLFDIQVTSGTSSSFGIDSSGSISGEASTGTGDNNRIYMVAVPKNQALTMAIRTGSTLGFDIAGAADVDGNAIVLSAGHDIASGKVAQLSTPDGAGEDWITIGGVTVTSALTAQAQSRVHLFTPTNVASNFASNVSLIAPVSVYANAEAVGATLTISGNLELLSNVTSQSAGGSATGGQATLYAINGGDVVVNGDVLLSADGQGGAVTNGVGPGGNGTGGSVSAYADGAGSTVTVNGNLTSHADGYGGLTISGVGGTGTGGFAQSQATGGGSLTIGGDFSTAADGWGGSGSSGGEGRGGTAIAQSSGGGSTVQFNADASISADGQGGALTCTLCGGSGGNAFGGNAFLVTGSGAVGNPATITVQGQSFVTTNAAGGFGGINGGNAIGGGVAGSGPEGAVVTFGANSSINLQGGLTIESTGVGGSSDTSGGHGTGGRARTGSQTAAIGGSLTIGGLMDSNVSGTGGTGFDGNGGNGIGGQNDNGGDSGTINYNNVQIRAQGFGGTSASASGGAGTGGQAWIDSFGATIGIAGNYFGYANGIGGSGGLGGGEATGGRILLVSGSATNPGSLASVGGWVELYANATGGTGYGGNGGNATAGEATIVARQGGTLNIVNEAFAYAEARGGETSATGGVAGNATGGDTRIGGFSGGILNIGGSAYAYSMAFGGGSDIGGQSGNATGGEAAIHASGGAQVTIGGSAFAGTDAYGGFNGECFSCGGTPGSGTGGFSHIYSFQVGSVLNITGDVFVTADGQGGRSNVGLGGNGFGGSSYLVAQAGGTTNVGGLAVITANGQGAPINFSELSGGTAGNGEGGIAGLLVYDPGASTLTVGGTAEIVAIGLGGSGDLEMTGVTGGNGTGGSAYISSGNQDSITVDGSVTINANGIGGTVGSQGVGGNGTGGFAQVFVNAGALSIGTNIEESLSLTASGTGADAFDGLGGDATGGSTYFRVNAAGTATLAGSLFMNGSATGGHGNIGGDATALTTPLANEQLPQAAALVVQSSGTISIAGSANLNGNATGGNGSFGSSGGTGGLAVAGELDVNATVGTISMNSLNISGQAHGGLGGEGANGGAATGGRFDVTFGPADPITATLNLGDVNIAIDAFGGAGGNGLSGTIGGNGGNGGDATISTDTYNQFTASGAGGTLNAGNVVISAQAHGGAGGDGGFGANGAGGSGGTGGNAQGGAVQTGSISNSTSPIAGGAFTVGNLTLDTSIFGGAGGNGGLGSTTGNGGDGGDAGTLATGVSFLGVRGLVGTVGNVSLYSNATGGNGGQPGDGIGGIQGNGGNAIGGTIAVESKDRFEFPNQRGNLIAGAIYGESISTGGAGSIAGTSTTGSGNSFRIYNGDATIASLQFVIQGNIPSALGSDYIAIVDGAANVIGNFSFNTDNNLALYANRTNTTLDQASLTATNMILTARNFVPFAGSPVMGAEIDPATRPGTYFADTFTITTDNNFYTTANLDSVNLLEIIAPGSITTGNINGDNAVYLNAQSGDITVKDITAGQEISLTAANLITAMVLDSGSYISAQGQAIQLNDAISTGDTYLQGTNYINFSMINAGGGVQLLSSGMITGGSATAGTSIDGYTDGSMDLGPLTAGTSIFLTAQGNIDLVSAIAGQWIELQTGIYGDFGFEPGGYIATGALTAGDTIEVHAGTFADLGNLSAGIVNPDMNPEAQHNIAVLAGETINVASAAATGDIGFAAPGGITAGDVDAAHIFMALGGDVTLGTVHGGDNVYIGNYSMMALGGTLTEVFNPLAILAVDPVATNGEILISGPVTTGKFQAAAGFDFIAGNISSDSLIWARADGNMQLGILNAVGDIDLLALGDLTTNDLTTTGSGGDITVQSDGQTTVDVVNAAGAVFLSAEGATGGIAFTSIDANDGVTLTSANAVTGGNISNNGVGSISVTGGSVEIGNLLAQNFIRVFGTNGSISIGNANATNGFITLDTDGDPVPFPPFTINVGTSISAGNLTATGGIDVLAGTSINLQTVNGGGYIYMFANDGGLSALDITSTGSAVDIHAQNALTVGDLDASTSVNVQSLGGFQVTTGNIVAGTHVNVHGTGGPVNTQDITAGEYVRVGGSDVTLGSVIAGQYIEINASDLSFGSLDADDYVSLVISTLADGGDITAGTSIDAHGSGDFNFGNLDAGTDVDLGAQGNIVTANIVAGTLVDLGSFGNITTNAINAGTDVQINLAGDLSTGDITAVQGITVAADGGAGLGNLAAGGVIDLTTVDLLQFGNVSTPLAFDIDAAGGISGGNVNADILDAISNGDMTFGDITTLSELVLSGVGAITTGDIDTSSFVDLSAGTNLSTGTIDASSGIDLTAGGTVTTGSLFTTLGPILVNAGSNLLVNGNIDAGSAIELFAGGDITADDLFAGTYVYVDADGDVALGNISAGLGGGQASAGIGTQDIGPGNPVEIFSANIATGNIVTDGYVGLYTPGTLNVGTITADHDIIALVGGNASLGAIAGGESFTLAGYANFASLDNGDGGINPALLFSLPTLAATGGNATIAGPSTVNSFTSRVGGDTSFAALASATSINAQSGGLIRVDGQMTAANIQLVSGDIDIGSTGSIVTSNLFLGARTGNGALIGDGVESTLGYRLSQAEFDRIDTPVFEFELTSPNGTNPFLTFGDLTLDVSGSQILNPLHFAVNNDSSQIRIIGDVVIRTDANQMVSFSAETFALDAATGSLSLHNGNGGLSGILGLEAPNIFIASGAIIDKLLVDPRYAGYIDELNAPAAVQRPEGVIRAADYEIGPVEGDVVNLLIQNTGTSETPAGFVVGDNLFGDGSDLPPPGSVNLVINGQIVSATGTLTGIAVRDAMVAVYGTEPFVAGSTINGCELAGSCSGGTSNPPPDSPEFIEIVTAATVPPAQVALLGSDPLGEAFFGNEMDIGDGVEGGSATEQASPITPPQPLFDSRPLIDEGLIDEPISGTGNPSLYGVSSEDEDEEEKGDKNKDGAKPAKTGGGQ